MTTFPVLIDINNEENLLLIGMNTDVEIQILKKDVSLSIPTMSLRTRKDIYTAAAILNIDKVLGPKSSILASRAFSALEPIPITVITAAVPMIIAKAVKNDLTPFVLIEDTADFIDSSTNIIQN